MPIIDTSTLQEGQVLAENEQIYNGLDCCVTFEVFNELHSLGAPRIYNFTRALQAPVLDMMQRGFLIDSYERQKGIETLEIERDRLLSLLNRFAYAVWDAPLNANSPQMLKAFFYDAMHLPEVWTSKKGERKLSLDREALEKLDNYFHARPIVSTILAIRDVTKQLSVLRTEVDSDGRMRTSYNVAGTETGRFSSSTNAFGGGCVLPTTEVLTRDGWKQIQSVLEGEEIAQYSLSRGGTIEFVPCGMYKTHFDGNLLQVKTEQIQQTLTPGHRVLRFDARLLSSYVEAAQDVMALSQCVLPLGGRMLDGEMEFPSFLPMLMADFSKENKIWRGAFKKTRKIERFLQLAKQFNLSYEEFNDKREGYRRFTVRNQEHLPKQWGKWVLDLSESAAELLLEEARHWDAHDRKSGFIFYTVDKEQAEWFAVLAHRANKSATIRRQDQHRNSFSTGTIWCVNVKNRKHARVQHKHWKTIPYAGPVYCPQVPSSFWVMRENNYISITGNTNLQNITASLRKMFVADPGYKLCGIDLEQAESREVGWLSGTICGDWSYLDACYSGDLHTLVARTAWPDLPWTGDPKLDRRVAETPFYRHLTYRDMAKKLGHGCLTDDHEVLTRNGWTSITNKPREILAWTDGRSAFEEVSHWTDFPYTGTLHSFEGASISAQMTADHRIPYKSDQRSPLKVKQAKDGPGTFMPLGGDYVGGDQSFPARLVAAFMSDGHQHTKNSMKFHFHKQRKIDRLITLCQYYGFSYRVALPYIYVEGALPKEPGWWMLDLTQQCLLEFLDEYKHWDGHVSPTAVSLFSKHKEHLEIIQTLGRICGIGGNIQKPQTSGFGTEMFRLQQNNRKWASGKSVTHTTTQVVDLRVLCPTVRSSYFYVRRNGKIYVTGNSNYYGQPPTMAKHAKIPVAVADHFQRRYFRQFPGIPKWHRWTAQQLHTTQSITTPFGRQRTFFGRAHDDATLREAIAFSPQSTTADRMNLVLWRIWKYMPQVQLIAQIHDALYAQYRETEDETAIIEEMLSHFDIAGFEKDGHRLIVPGEAKVGWNWGNFDPKSNPDGLKKWKEGQVDERKRTPLLQQKL